MTMLPIHLCFPKDWIGKTPVKVGDNTYYIGNDATKQIVLPDGYGKPINATWLSNGVFRVYMDTNGTQLFFVGSQRFFPSYGDETEPHETIAYNEAVKECQRSREEEPKSNNPRPSTHGKDNESLVSRNEKPKSSSSALGSVIAGAGAFIGSARKSIKDFKSIDDSSKFEADLEREYVNLVNQQQKEIADSYKRAADDDKRMQRNADRRNKALEILRAREQVFDAKNNKKRIFKNLYLIFTSDEKFIPDNLICKYSSIFDPDHKAALSRVMKGYWKSQNEMETSDKFIQCWSEIIYLIEEGVLFQDDNVEEIVKIINNTCGQNNETNNLPSFDEYLKTLYLKIKGAYWGYDFGEDPKESIVKEKISYLEDNIFFEEDYDKNYIFDVNSFVDIDKEIEKSQQKKKGEIINVLKKHQNNLGNLGVAITDLLGVDPAIPMYACTVYGCKQKHSQKETEMWADVFYRFLQGEKLSISEIDTINEQIEFECKEDDCEISLVERKENSKIGNNNDDNRVTQPKQKPNQNKEGYKAEKNSKYSELESIGFIKDNCSEDFKEPKSVLDIITKSKNKKIANKKEKWNDALWNFDHKLKKKVLEDILKIEGKVVKLLKLEDEMCSLTENGHSSGFLGLGGSKELKKVKSDIKEIKEEIEKDKNNLARSLRDLRYCERDIKDLQEELYELTKLEKYVRGAKRNVEERG